MIITNDDIKYVIVQAGGKGTRMGRFAENKPKCLVPVNDIPIIVNTLNVYKDKKVIIIADYLSNVLETYLNVFYNGDNYNATYSTDVLFTEEVLGVNSIIYVKSDEFAYTISEQFPYWNYETQGPFMKNCQEPFTGIFIYEDYTQEWAGYCENNQYDNQNDCELYGSIWKKPYYPVLPKYNKYGKFDEENLGLQNNNKPFGSGEKKWDGDDNLAAASLTKLPKTWLKNCLIDLDFSVVEENTVNDVGPITNLGILMDDYKVMFDEKTNKPFAPKKNTSSKIGKNNKDKPF